MERKEIKASFIVRAYNSEATIARTMRSALSQDFPHAFEIVVIDDGSTDNTATVVESFADARIRLIRQENKGITEAANVGLREAQGDFVVLLDADDEAKPNYLSDAARALGDPAIEYAYGDYLEEYRDMTTSVTPGDPFKAPAGAFAWRRNKMLSEGGFSGDTLFPEYDILLRTWGAWSGIHIASPLFVYHRSTTSITGSSSRVHEAIARLGKRYPSRAREIALIRSYELV